MANICYVNCVIVSFEDKNKISKFFDFISESRMKDIPILDVCEEFGINKNKISNLRVSIVYSEELEFKFDIDSAWSTPIDFINSLESVLDCSIKWCSSEPGCGIFETNDFEFEYFDKYEIVIDDDYYYAKTEEDAVSIINGILLSDTSLPKINSLSDFDNEIYEDIDEERNVIIREFVVV